MFGHKLCVFQEYIYDKMTTLGPKHAQVYDWVIPSELGDGYAKCQYCPSASLNITSMGGSALRSHAEGTKHRM